MEIFATGNNKKKIHIGLYKRGRSGSKIGIILLRVRVLCAEGRIPGMIRHGK